MEKTEIRKKTHDTETATLLFKRKFIKIVGSLYKDLYISLDTTNDR